MGLFDQKYRTANAKSEGSEILEIKNEHFGKAMSNEFIKWIERRNKMFNIKFELDDLTIVRPLGEGNYGMVFLV